MADVTMNATMKTNYTTYTFYFGPGGAGTFEKVGSVSAGEKVRVNWREGTYSNITYVVNSTGKYKTGYVQTKYVYSNASIDDRTDEINNLMKSTYRCPSSAYVFYRQEGDSGECVGSVSAGELFRQVWTLGLPSPRWTYIQYTVDSTQKYKRGWVYW